MHQMCAQCTTYTTYTTYTTAYKMLVYLIFFNWYLFFISSQICQNPEQKVKCSFFTQKFLVRIFRLRWESRNKIFRILFFFFLGLKFRDYAKMQKVQLDFVRYMYELRFEFRSLFVLFPFEGISMLTEAEQQ